MESPLVNEKTKGIRIKFVLIGDIKVGKTSIFKNYVNHKIIKEYNPTIGIDENKIMIEKNQKTFVLKIEDTSGNEKFLNEIKSHYDTTNIILIVFDLTNKESFLSVNKWINHVLSAQNKNNNIKLVLIGNKRDLEVNRQVSKEEANKLAEANSMKYYEISAFNEEEVKLIFEDGFKLFSKIFTKNEQNIPESLTEVETYALTEYGNKSSKKKKFRCCNG